MKVEPLSVLATAAPRTAPAVRATPAGARRVLVATFVTLGLTYGFWYAYSVFLVAFLGEFGWSRSSWPGRSLCSSWCTASPGRCWAGSSSASARAR